MSDEQLSGENDSVHNNSSSEKPINSFLNEFDRHQYEQDFNKFIDVLVSIIYAEPLDKEPSFLKSVISIIIGSLRWFVVGIVTLTVVIYLAESIPNFKVLLVGAYLMLFIVTLFFEAKKFIKSIKATLAAEQSSIYKAKLGSKKLRNEFIMELALVKILRDNISLDKLKLYEIEIDKQIKNIQSNERVKYNLWVLFVTVIITSIGINILGNQFFNDLNNISLNSSNISLWGLAPIVIGVVNSLYVREDLYKLNKCLSCVKKAQVKQDVQESQLEQSGEK